MTVMQGDSAVVLGHCETASIEAVVTDPPHGLFFMSENWDADLPEQAIWDECFRVLKPGGHAFVMSSERLGCLAGLYMSLHNAGFAIDNHQIINWLSCTGMPKSSSVGKTADKEAFRAWLDHIGRECIPCPDHDGKADRCPECERVFSEGTLTHHDKRKAASAAVNGDFEASPNRREAHRQGGAGFDSATGGDALSFDLSLLTRLLSLHWPASPAERRAQWEACVAEVPEGWDCGRPPGVRVKTGTYCLPPDSTSGAAGQPMDERYAMGGRTGSPFERGDTGSLSITAPSTPDAVRWDGWRGSTAPLKPFCYPIIHAQKPREGGSYLANARAHGVGPLNMESGRIPYDLSQDREYWNEPASGRQYERTGLYGIAGKRSESAAGRTPANLLAAADLLGDLQRYADLEAWCERLDLPPEAADILEAGLIYAPKPSHAEKSRGLPDDYSAKRNPCAKPVALCAYLIALCTREGQTVLDPFCGEAPVGVAAALLKRDFVGVELEPDFCKTARLRIEEAAATITSASRDEQQGALFG